jgi:nucleoside-diphosphate-sugar epimerase
MASLVTGATGFLGSRLLTRLLEGGREVRAVSRLPIPDQWVGRRGLVWIQRDLSSEELRQDEVEGVETVFHLAGATLGAGYSEGLFFSANEATTLHLLKGCAGQVKRIVHASSQVVYGDVGHLGVTEDFPLSGIDSAYACSKVNAENWLRWFQFKKGGVYVILRFSGFVEGGGAIGYMINQALQDKQIELFSGGMICRDYLPVAHGITALLLASRFVAEAGYYPFNIGSGQALTMLDLASIVCDEVRSSSKTVPLAEPAPRSNFVFDISRAKNVLGFSPPSLESAVRSHARERLNTGSNEG